MAAVKFSISSAPRKLENIISEQVPETGFEFYSDGVLATAFLATAIVAAKRCVFLTQLLKAFPSVAYVHHPECHLADRMREQKQQLSPPFTALFS
jgi:hypothetical protein